MSILDDIIKDKAYNHQSPVPPNAWENIVKKKRKRKVGFFWCTLAALLLASLSTAVYFTIFKTAKIQPTNATEIAKSTLPEKEATKMIQEQIHLKNQNGKTESTTATNNTVADKNAALQLHTNTNSNFNVASKQQTNEYVDKKIPLKTHKTYSNGLSKNSHHIKENVTKYASSNTSKLLSNNTILPNVFSAKQNRDKAKKSTLATALSIKKVKGKMVSTVIKIEPDETSQIDPQQYKATTVLVETEDKSLASTAIISTDKYATKPLIALPTKDSVALIHKNQANKTSGDQIKKQISNAEKFSKNKYWGIDIAATPVLPIQQYSQPTSFSRTVVTDNNVSTFSGKLVSTSIDPAVAFSLAVVKRIHHNTSVGIGFQYLQIKEHITISGTETNTHYNAVNRLVNGSTTPQLITDTLQTITQGIRNIIATNSYQWYSIPIFIQYNFVQRSSWSAGIVGGLFVNVSN